MPLVRCGLRNRDRLERIVRVRIGAPAEAAAGIELRDLDLLGLERQQLGDGRLISRVHLLAVPDLAALVPEAHQTVHRLHGGMRQEWKFVVGGHELCCAGERRGDIALVLDDGPGLLGETAVVRGDVAAVAAVRCGIVPLNLECVASAPRDPGILGQYGHAAEVSPGRGKLHHIDDARDGFGTAGIEALTWPPKRGG